MKKRGRAIKTVFLVLMLASPLGSFAGVHTCVKNGVATFSDQPCRETARSEGRSAEMPAAPGSNLLTAYSESNAEQSSPAEQRKVLERRIEAADEELRWMYRERRAAIETFVSERSAGTGPEGQAVAQDVEQEREAFEKRYDKTIKVLRRELVEMRAELESLQAGRT